MTTPNITQTNINEQQQKQFNGIIENALKFDGLNLTSAKGFGKTRFLMAIAEYLRSLPNCRTIVFDGSLAWLYGFSKIPVFDIAECDITAKRQKDVLEVENFSFNNWELVKLALQTEKDLLFRLKTKKPSKRGFAVRQIINYLDNNQRTEKEQTPDHNPKNAIAYIIEESQDTFNIRSTMRTDSEEFLTVFNEARNNREAFFTCSQRLNDFSKTIRTKQNYALGKINSEDITPALRRLEKQCKIDFANMALRTWLINGQIIKSPDFKQDGKPYIINAQIRQQYFKPSEQIKDAWLGQPKRYNLAQKLLRKIFSFLPDSKPNYSQQSDPDSEESNSREDSQADGLMTDDKDIMFPEEF